MQDRIAELNMIALAEQPPRRVRNVRGAGACFFHALLLAIQPDARVADEDAMDEAGLSARRKHRRHDCVTDRRNPDTIQLYRVRQTISKG